MHEDQNKRPRSLDAIGGELRAAIARDEQQATPRRSRHRFALAFAVAGVLAAALFATISLVGDEQDSVFNLDEAVAAVAKAAFDMPGAHPGKYLHIKAEEMYIGESGLMTPNHEYEWAVVQNQVRESWSRPDRALWTRTFVQPTTYPTERDKKTEEAAERWMRRDWRRRNPGKPQPRSLLGGTTTSPATIVCRVTGRARAFAFQDQYLPLRGVKFSDLPEDPKAMYKVLKRQTRSFRRGFDSDRWVWDTIVWTMRTGAPVLTAPQRAALVGALGEIPGVQTYGVVTDPGGREAIGFSRTKRGTVSRAYFDPATSLTSYSDQLRQGKDASGRKASGQNRWRLLNYEYVDRPPKMQPSRRNSARHFVFCPSFR